jgi:hypothetical protein
MLKVHQKVGVAANSFVKIDDSWRGRLINFQGDERMLRRLHTVLEKSMVG